MYLDRTVSANGQAQLLAQAMPTLPQAPTQQSRLSLLLPGTEGEIQEKPDPEDQLLLWTLGWVPVATLWEGLHETLH